MNVGPLQVAVSDGRVVLIARGECGVPVSAEFTPEAILASLSPLRYAAESAILGRTVEQKPLLASRVEPPARRARSPLQAWWRKLSAGASRD